MRFHVLPPLAAIALFAACGGTPQPTATGTPADEQAIRGLANAWATAYSTRDTKPVAAVLANDYEDVTPQGVHEQGSKAMLDQMSKDMASMPPGMQMTMTATTAYVRFLNDKAAVAGGTYTMAGGPPGMPSKGAWMGVAVKQDSTWKMLSSLGSDDDSEMMAAMMANASNAKPKGK
jgi:uncharacterized protein (TIGR02246 family)